MPWVKTDPAKERVKFILEWERRWDEGEGRVKFTAIDDCTRIRVLKIYDACNQATAIRFVDEVIRRLPFCVATETAQPGSRPPRRRRAGQRRHQGVPLVRLRL